jgi:threonine dehydrogenase-like Zn-dependent dehydrogenase
MRRLLTMVATGRMDLTPLVTHRFDLDDLEDAYDVFSHQREGVMKVAIYPQGVPSSESARLEIITAVL